MLKCPVDDKLGEEIRKAGIFNMLRAWDKEKILVPDGNRTHDLPHRVQRSEV